MFEQAFRSQTEKHELSALYEEKIKRMGNAGRNGGEYYTPRPPIRAMIRVVNPKLGETLYDGACGSAGFLCEAFDYLRRANPRRTTAQDKALQERTFYGNHSDLTEFVTGLTGPKLNQGSLRKIPIPVPPLAEQQRIVGVLDEAFAGLATAQANAAKNLQNARALFESHLQSVFTHRGKGWVENTLEEVSTILGRGKSKHRPRNAPHLYGGKYPFAQTGDIRSANHTVSEYAQTYSEAGLAQSKLWPKGTLCITIAANIAETAILGFDACFPDSVIGVVADPAKADVGFIEYLLQFFKARIQAMGNGSAQANINLGTFDDERFPFPPVPEQKRIVAQLDAFAAATQRLSRLYEQKQAALAALKKSLLHQAFGGEV